ncbi:hypothetical protein EDD22DRAFT_1027134 [Suillus occidentalis]|nr:hypothetical protein EDD22DRAFT_1027134 [Suillus occidentalis]
MVRSSSPLHSIHHPSFGLNLVVPLVDIVAVHVLHSIVNFPGHTGAGEDVTCPVDTLDCLANQVFEIRRHLRVDMKRPRFLPSRIFHFLDAINVHKRQARVRTTLLIGEDLEDVNLACPPPGKYSDYDKEDPSVEEFLVASVSNEVTQDSSTWGVDPVSIVQGSSAVSSHQSLLDELRSFGGVLTTFMGIKVNTSLPPALCDGLAFTSNG